MSKAYQAHAKGSTVTRDTPRAAALAFFELHASRRKCDVIEGTIDGHFFTVAYNPGNWPKSWKDVTKKTAATLPDTTQQ